MIDTLLLLSGNDIPFIQAEMVIHPPKIKEIAYIGQDNFFTGCQLLNFSKKRLKKEDKVRLDNFNDFEILMKIMKNTDAIIQKDKVCMQLVLSLIFPDFIVGFLPNRIMLSRKDQETNQIERHFIDETNFQQFKEILMEMFCLSQLFKKSGSQYNPGGPQAQALVQKFKKRHKILAEQKNKGKSEERDILTYYISILSVGLQKDMNQLLQYTVYQLFDEFRRFKMKTQYDMYVQIKMAGAKDLDEIENWMSVYHSDTT